MHNFNYSFIISIDLCLFICKCLQQHLPIGSLVNVLESQLQTTLNSQIVLNAYLYFDSLSMHSYDFHCPVSDLHLPEEYKCEANLVDSDDLRVEMTMLLRSLSSQKVPALDVKPNILRLAPYIGRQSRKSALLYGTLKDRVTQWRARNFLPRN